MFFFDGGHLRLASNGSYLGVTVGVHVATRKNWEYISVRGRNGGIFQNKKQNSISLGHSFIMLTSIDSFVRTKL